MSRHPQDDSTPLEHLELAEGPEGLELRQEGDRAGQGVQARPFLVLTRGLTSHPLTKILNKVDGPVVDATAGLGTDGGIAAALGKNVLFIERNEIVYALLKDAIDRAFGEEEKILSGRMTLLHDDACSILRKLPEGWESPGAVLLDPMFPPRRKQSALPQKPMQRLRELCGYDDSDVIESLLKAAAESSARRVVLKRPPEASISCSELGLPTFTVETKLLRWDVWDRGD